MIENEDVSKLYEDSLTFEELREKNLARCEQSYHPGPDGIFEWSITDWATAVGGEAGSVLHIAKKMRRELDENGWMKVGEIDSEATKRERRDRLKALREQLAEELADLVIYADLLAAHEGIDLGAAVVRKFNLKSEEIGSGHKL